MNWEAISAIGEAVGAAAVVFTLIYLAIQVRHAREQQEVQTAGIAIQTSMYAAESLFLGDNPELIKRGLEDLSSLDPGERSTFHLLLSRNLAGLASLQRSDDPLCQAIAAWYRDEFYGTPGGTQWLAEFPDSPIKRQALSALESISIG